MDKFIRRIRSLSFISVVSGALSAYVVVSFLTLQDDFDRVQRLFFAHVLISEDYTATVDPLHVQVEFAEAASEEDWVRIKTSNPPAISYIGETNDYFDADISLKNGTTYKMRVAETVRTDTSGENAYFYDLLAPDELDQPDVGLESEYGYVTGKGVNCPSFQARTETSFNEEWKLTCYQLTRIGANNESESVWIIDGRPIDMTYDMMKEDKLFYIDERPRASGSSTYFSTYSKDELRAELLELTERHFVGNGDEESQYLGIRKLFYSQEFNIPIVNVKASFGEYFLYFSYLSLILAYFCLHTSIGLYQRSASEYPEEPWVMLTGKSNSRFGKSIRHFLRLCGLAATVISITLPSIAIMLYIYRLDVPVNVYRGLVIALTIVFQLSSLAYLLRSVLRLERIEPLRQR